MVMLAFTVFVKRCEIVITSHSSPQPLSLCGRGYKYKINVFFSLSKKHKLLM